MDSKDETLLGQMLRIVIDGKPVYLLQADDEEDMISKKIALELWMETTTEPERGATYLVVAKRPALDWGKSVWQGGDENNGD